jgi:hypothetical protein
MSGKNARAIRSKMVICSILHSILWIFGKTGVRNLFRHRSVRYYLLLDTE